VIVVGELINTTRKSVQKALAEKDEATIRRLAREQVEAGADILDINTATSMEKEIDDMKWVVGLIYDEVWRYLGYPDSNRARPEVQEDWQICCTAPTVQLNKRADRTV